MPSALDLAILVAFLAYSLASGLRSRRVAAESLEEYFLAGRTLPGYKAGLSMAATQFAADTPLLVTGLIATAGLFSLWRLWIYALAFLLLGFLLGAAWRRAGVLTDAELAELRYGTRLATVLRAAKALYFGGVFNCTVLAMVLFAATRIAEPFLVWDQWLPPALHQPWVELLRHLGLSLTSSTDPARAEILSANNLLSLLAIVTVTTFYSTTGGLRAVVATDLVQFAIVMLATLIYAVVLIERVGGLGALPARLTALYGAEWTTATLALTPDRARDAGALVLGTIAIQWLAQMNADGTGYLAQRTMACRSDRDARQAAVVFTVAQILLRSLLWIPIGLALLVLFPLTPGEPGSVAAAREATYVTGIAQSLPPGALGLMLTGMLAALASTVDTHLNWGSSYFTNDLYRRLYCQAWRGVEPSDRSLVWVARGGNLLILSLAAVILTQLDSIEMAWKTSLLLGAGMGVPLVLRWIWWRVTAGAELGAILGSSLLAPLLLWAVPAEGARLLLMTLTTTAIAIGLSLASSAAPSAAVIEFYRRVRPPGLWGPVARACDDEPARGVDRLRSGLLGAGAAAVVVFSLLVASASWLYQSPAPALLPSRGAWIGGLLALAAGLGLWLWRRRETP